MPIAPNPATCVALARQTLSLIDQLIKQNEAVDLELKRLGDLSRNAVADVRFPDFGLSEQLPFWRQEYANRIKTLRSTEGQST